MASIIPIASDKAHAARIVLVEDNPTDVYLLNQALHQRGIQFDLVQYEDGEQAINAISSDTDLKPDLILVDLNLPRREGFDVLAKVRQTPRLVGVPVGVFTSSNAAKDRHRIALIGVERYIHKPATLEAFLTEVGAAVEDMLTLRQERDSASGSLV